MRCKNCNEQVLGSTAVRDWHKLINYLTHELTEGEITAATFDDLANTLMSLRPEEDTEVKHA